MIRGIAYIQSREVAKRFLPLSPLEYAEPGNLVPGPTEWSRGKTKDELAVVANAGWSETQETSGPFWTVSAISFSRRLASAIPMRPARYSRPGGRTLSLPGQKFGNIAGLVLSFSALRWSGLQLLAL
jgi:hypothetical protein